MPLHRESTLPLSEHGGIFIASGFKCCDFLMVVMLHPALSKLHWGWVKPKPEMLIPGCNKSELCSGTQERLGKGKTALLGLLVCAGLCHLVISILRRGP